MNSSQYFIIAHFRCSIFYSTISIKDNELKRGQIESRSYTLWKSLGVVPETARDDGVCCIAARTARSTKSQLELDDPTLRLDILLPVGVLLPLPGRDLLL